MDCPHCGEENLLGAKICVSCGRNMRSLPAFRPNASATSTQAAARQAPVVDETGPEPPTALGAASASAPPPRGKSPPVHALCRVCLDGFDRRADDVDVTMCPKCRSFAPVAGGDAGQNDVTFHPASQEQPGVDPRAGSALPRPRPVAKRATLRTGPVVAAACLAVGLLTTAVVVAAGREKDPAAECLAEVKREDATLVLAPRKDGVTRLVSTFALTLTREVQRANFSRELDRVLRLEQRTEQSLDVAWVRDDAAGAVVDVAAACRIAAQTGAVAGADAREVRAYPWEGFVGTKRLLLPATGAVAELDGEAPLVGRDVIPCLTLRDVGAPSGAVSPGAAWKTRLSLPFFMTREGGLLPADFACDVAYVGRRVQNGVECVALSLRAAAPRQAPSKLDDMNRTSGSFRAALFFDATTGLLAEARGFVDVAAWVDRGRVEDRVHVAGTWEARRR
jgi:hypothetical protein